MTAAHDWPTQSVYMKIILEAVVDPSTCLGTEIAQNLVAWLNIVSTDPGESMWWWNWYVFQPQYYAMPRSAGDRVESPATLGRKCWAFAFLRQLWSGLRPTLLDTAAAFELDLADLVAAWDDAVPMSLVLYETCF